MDIYIIILLFSFLFSFSKKELFGIILLIILFFVLAFRSQWVGTDTWMYLSMYSGWNIDASMSSSSSSRELELLWGGFLTYVRALDLNSRWILVIPAFATMVFYYVSAKRFGCRLNLFVFFLILFTIYFQSFNIVRQSLAISVVLWAYSYAAEKDMAGFMMAIAMASMIHFSAVFCLPLYFIMHFDLSFRVKLCLLVGSFVIGYMGVSLDSLAFLSAYDAYSDYLVVEDRFSVGRLLMKLSLLGISIYVIYKDRVHNQFISNMFMFSVIADNICMNVHPFVARMTFYLIIIQPVYFVMYFMNVGKFYFRNIVFGSLVLCRLIFYIHYLSINSGEIVPYSVDNNLL